MIRRAFTAFALGVFCAGSVLAHQDGAGSHEAWKHDLAAESVSILLYDADIDMAEYCNKGDERDSFLHLMKIDPEDLSPPTWKAMRHAWHIEYRKACRAAGFEYD